MDESHSIVGMDRRQLLLRGAALATAVGTFGSVERAMAAGRAGGGLELWHWQAGNAYPDIFGAAGKRWSTKTEGKFHQTSVPYTSYWAKFKTAVAGGSTPDVMEMSWTGQYRDLIKANTLAPHSRDVQDAAALLVTLVQLQRHGQVIGEPHGHGRQ